MHKFNKYFCVCLAAVMLLAGCGKSDNSQKTKKAETSAVQSSDEDSSKIEKSYIGKYLSALGDKIKQGKYTVKCTVSYSNSDDKMQLTRVVSDENVYQLQEEANGSYGIISVDGKSYNFDNAAGMYQETDAKPPLSIVEEVINRNFPQSEDIEIELPAGTVAERYIFTGETYITYITFVFDEKTGDLKEYTLTYSEEDKSDVTETRTVDLFEYKADEAYFDTAFLHKLKDFANLTNAEKKAFCQEICASRGITADDLEAFDISEDDFEKIDFGTFLNLIYSANKS